MKKLMVFIIRFYRKNISPLKPPCCRFTPTCSEYALEAYEKYGFFKGTFLAVRRLIRCNMIPCLRFSHIKEKCRCIF